MMLPRMLVGSGRMAWSLRTDLPGFPEAHRRRHQEVIRIIIGQVLLWIIDNRKPMPAKHTWRA